MDSENFDIYLPVYGAIPNEWSDAQAFLTETIREISTGVNDRASSYYVTSETLAGKKVIPGSSSREFRQVFRKVIDFGTLPNTTSTSVAHGITWTSTTTLLYAYGAATDPTAVNSISFSTSNLINLVVDNTNVTVTTTADYSGYTRTFITLEYIQET